MGVKHSSTHFCGVFELWVVFLEIKTLGLGHVFYSIYYYLLIK